MQIVHMPVAVHCKISFYLIERLFSTQKSSHLTHHIKECKTWLCINGFNITYVPVALIDIYARENLLTTYDMPSLLKHLITLFMTLDLTDTLHYYLSCSVQHPSYSRYKR